ncbi:MAG: hypothetical protein ABJM43_19830 [Paracoccaceae bacterium]
MKISGSPLQPEVSVSDALAAPPALTASQSPEVSTQGASDKPIQNDEGLNKAQTEELAEHVADDIQEPLETQQGQKAFGDALDGETAATRSTQEQAKTDKAVDHLAEKKPISDLDVQVVSEDDPKLSGNANSQLLGPVDQPTLYLSAGLTPEEVGEEVQAAAIEIAEDVANIYGVDMNLTTFTQFVSSIVSSSVAYFAFHTVLDDYYQRQDEDALDELRAERAAREALFHRRSILRKGI